MEQSSNRTNALSQIPAVTEKRIQEHRPKRSDELVLTDPQQFFGMDKNLIITLALTGLSMGLSIYLFREVKKIRDDVRVLKTQDVESIEKLEEKVDENGEAVKAIEIKLDQLITALTARETRYQQQQQQQQPRVTEQDYNQQMVQQQMAQQQMAQQQMAQQQMAQQQMAQQQMAQQQMAQQQMAQQQMAQQQMTQQMEEPMNQSIPVMGGRIAGSAITMDDPGIIKI
jgi:flagellar biosynthesis GTPase FlhF